MARAPAKPIHIFYSPLTGRLYASRHYKVEGPGLITITGEKIDVTNEIAGLIAAHNLAFTPRPAPPETEKE
jgi:hypothetical protein